MKALFPLLYLAFSLLASAVDFSTAEIGGKHFTVCKVDVKKETLGLYLQDDKHQPFKRFSHLAAFVQTHCHKLVFAMNGGMYHGDFSPVGLFVSEGSLLTPLNKAQRRVYSHR